MIAEAQYHQAWKNRGTTPPDYVDKSDVRYYQGVQYSRLAQAQAFDQAYPDPETLTPRDEMRQNETPETCLITPAPAPRDKTRQNGTPCSTAVAAALAPLRQAIAAVA